MSKIHQLLLSLFGHPTGQSLPQFSGESLPSEADVVRHYIWQCDELCQSKNLGDKTHILAKTNVANNLYEFWKNSGYQVEDLMAIGNVKKLVKSTYDRACKLSKVNKELRTKAWEDKQREIYSTVLDIKLTLGPKQPNNTDVEQVRVDIEEHFVLENNDLEVYFLLKAMSYSGKG